MSAPALFAVCGVAVPAALLRAEERREDGERGSLLQVCLLPGSFSKPQSKETGFGGGAGGG